MTRVYLRSYTYYRHARLCMDEGYPENAVSWMERWLGEAHSGLSWGCIDPKSLELDDDGNILFSTFAENLQGVGGDGI